TIWSLATAARRARCTRTTPSRSERVLRIRWRGDAAYPAFHPPLSRRGGGSADGAVVPVRLRDDVSAVSGADAGGAGARPFAIGVRGMLSQRLSAGGCVA